MNAEATYGAEDVSTYQAQRTSNRLPFNGWTGFSRKTNFQRLTGVRKQHRPTPLDPPRPML